MKEKTPFAAFILAPANTSITEYAATTRAVDRGESGKIGLPGGKVDPMETGEDAARRESMEEGWAVPTGAKLTKAHEDIVDGQLVYWYTTNTPLIKLTSFKEQGRIKPITATRQEISRSGYGNQWI